jgi:hypothetical protein
MSDRPLTRTFISIFFRALGRSRAHRQDIWPGLNINRSSGHVMWYGQPLLTLQRAAQIIPRGLPMIAVVGSGPSLKHQKIEAIGGDTAILCNGAATLADRIRPIAVAVEDERFVFRHHAMLVSLCRDIPLLLSPSALRAWAERDAASLKNRSVALIDNLEKPVATARRNLSDSKLNTIILRGHQSASSLDPEQGVVITGTVAFSAFQFALNACPARILLAGIDLANGNDPRFYEADDIAPSGLSKGLDRILSGFSLAHEEASRNKITLDCASPVSKLLSIGFNYTNDLS